MKRVVQFFLLFLGCLAASPAAVGVGVVGWLLLDVPSVEAKGDEPA
ncbi:MAG: hypothetical protein ACKO38_04980 [Planctomycetota bacterium]